MEAHGLKGRVFWQPAPRYIEGSHLQRLMLTLGLESYDELYRLSVDRPDRFWQATFEQLGLEWFTPYRQFVDLSRGKEWPDWFVGGRLNFVHNALRRGADPLLGSQTALTWEGEDGDSTRLTYRQLKEKVERCAAGLRRLGVGQGDRVGLWMPMLPEAVVAFLAAPHLGAVVVPMFSGYGYEAVATRLRDAGARVLVAADGFYRRGRRVLSGQVLEGVIREYPELEKVIIVNRLGEPAGETGREIDWQDLLDGQDETPPIEAMDPNDPCMLIYTSGTTGKPKGMVHTQGGFPFKATQDMAHIADLREGETLFWISDIGWLVGPIVITGALSLGGHLVIYEGAPDFPDWSRIGRIIERHEVTHLGCAPTLVRSLAANGGQVGDFDRTSLRMLLSTGEMWDPESFEWFFQEFGQGRAPVINYSGGTEISGGILGNVVYRPMTTGGFNSAVPGMRAAVIDDQGRPVLNTTGELAVLEPFVGMTRGFWGEPERYIETYWSRSKGIWAHGDLAVEHEDGSFEVLGRSDDVLKLAGKRVGPGEVEGVALEYPGLAEAAAVGLPDPRKGEVLALFVVAGSDATLGQDFEQDLARHIEERMGRSFRPERVIVVPQLPKTRNGKIMRRVIRRVFQGEPPGDLSGLDNPAAIASIKALAGK